MLYTVSFFHPPWFCRPAPGISPSIVRGHREPILIIPKMRREEEDGMGVSAGWSPLGWSSSIHYRDKAQNAVKMLRWFLASNRHPNIQTDSFLWSPEQEPLKASLLLCATDDIVLGSTTDGGRRMVYIQRSSSVLWPSENHNWSPDIIKPT